MPLAPAFEGVLHVIWCKSPHDVISQGHGPPTELFTSWCPLPIQASLVRPRQGSRLSCTGSSGQ
jgi:hypothetical protein